MKSAHSFTKLPPNCPDVTRLVYYGSHHSCVVYSVSGTKVVTTLGCHTGRVNTGAAVVSCVLL